mmetsp:Transcript_5616/g.21713  ORF Transcript_5616/g.21713 Transcript_5616/m.21713 type:complete len:259 (+) Transcript_5616:2137-2913(+)
MEVGASAGAALPLARNEGQRGGHVGDEYVPEAAFLHRGRKRAILALVELRHIDGSGHKRGVGVEECHVAYSLGIVGTALQADNVRRHVNEYVVLEENIVDSCRHFAACCQARADAERTVLHQHVGARRVECHPLCVLAALDADVVIRCANKAVGDCDVGAAVGVDAVGIGRPDGVHNADAVDADVAAHVGVEGPEGRVLHRHALHRHLGRVEELHQARPRVRQFVRALCRRCHAATQGLCRPQPSHRRRHCRGIAVHL